MRPLRFRAWNPETEQYDPYWCPLCRVGDNGELELIGFQDVAGNEQLIEDGAAIEQWTGRKDKHGKDIYAGDVVRTGPGGIVYQVESWGNVAGGFVLTFDGGALLGYLVECPDAEVIGNIRENPELLEVSHGQDQQP